MNFRENIKIALKKVLGETGIEGVEPLVEHPEDLQNGDYSTNIAMIAGKIAGKNPLQLAEQIKSEVEKSKLEIIAKVEVAPPGFINFWLSEAVISKELELALNSGERYGSSDLGKGKKIIVEYSSPNIAKRFGIGHLRSTIIGQSIYNMYQFLGFNTIGDNHIGDWGTQFGVMIAQIKNLSERSDDKLRLSVDDLEVLYVEFNRAVKDNPELWDEAKRWFKKLEEGDSEAKGIWEATVAISSGEFDDIYTLLDVKIDNAYGESYYRDMMGKIIQEAKDKNLAVESDGALIIELAGLPPGILLKSDGATTYFTRDLATIKFRMEKWNPERIIYETGVEQTLHFQQVFRTAELLGWLDGCKLVHVKHGLYLAPDGKKFSTRRGETVKLAQVLNEAVERASLILKEKPESGNSLDRGEVDSVARAVGIGAVKYFDLSHAPLSNIVFSWDKVFLLAGNSGPYLQYTYARTRSVLRKSGRRVLSLDSPTAIPPGNNSGAPSVGLPAFAPPVALAQEELVLLRTFYRFPEVIEEAALNYSPNHLANFLYDLTSKYNVFYNNLPILEPKEGDKVRNLRLGLTQVTANILKTGLGLLGISTPERM